MLNALSYKMHLRSIKKKLRGANGYLAWQFGIDLVRFFRAAGQIPRYIRSAKEFRRAYSGKFKFFPCLHDRFSEAGDAASEYFQQDLFVAQEIYKSNPVKVVDVGSRIDGFVAHVASFREIEVFDIRHVAPIIPGVKFMQADLMSATGVPTDYCDAVTCLHALEHFGLGRYGDPISSDGHVLGFTNLSVILKVDGLLYLSVPCGTERVEFNAHRIFSARKIVRLAAQLNLNLIRLSWIPNGEVLKNSDDFHGALDEIDEQKYALSIFVFQKVQC